MVNDYEDLPEDPELAFVAREEILRGELWEAIEESTPISYDIDRKLNYLSKLMAFHDAYELKLIERPHLYRGVSDFNFIFDQFMDDITYLVERIRVAHGRRIRTVSTIIKLDNSAKAQIHHLIAKIREIIGPIELPIKKKEAISKKLAALSLEIDCERTKGEAYVATVIEVAGVAGEAATKLKPVKELLDSIGSVIGKAKDIYEALKLEAPKEVKRIEAPKNRLPAPTTTDDEIPF